MNQWILIAAGLLLASCSQSDPPSDEVEKAAQEVVRVVEGAPAAEQSARGPYAPRDDCGELPGASEFRQRLDRAINERDAAALVELAASDVQLGSGDANGTDELRSRLAAQDGALWRRLEPLTRLGCAVNAKGGMTLPWYFEQRLPVDAAEGFIVTGEDVPVYNAPAEDAEVIARVSWEAVEGVRENAGPEGYRRVRWETERAQAVAEEGAEDLVGYVEASKLRSTADYRLIAASRNGIWRIISLVAGD